MKTINLYVCDICGKESRAINTMQEHEKKCKKEYAIKLKREDTYKDELKHFCQELDLDNIQDVINNYVEKMFGDHFDKITIDAHFNEHASNSHCAPIGGIENWHSDTKKPFSYPAYIGKIKGTYSKKSKTLSDYSRCYSENYPIPVNTGTGGGDGKTWQYSFTLFLSDFDKLAARVAKLYLQEA